MNMITNTVKIIGMGSPSNKFGTSTVTGHAISCSCWLVNKASCYTQHAFVIILEYILWCQRVGRRLIISQKVYKYTRISWEQQWRFR